VPRYNWSAAPGVGPLEEDMEEHLEVITWVAGAIVTASAVVFAIRRLLHLYRPIGISAGYTLSSQDGSTDTINVSVVNKSRETQYITGCRARGVYPVSSVIRRFIKKPFFQKKWWKTARYDVLCHELMGKEPIKLEPFEEISLYRLAFSHPISLYLTSSFVVEVTLSTKRMFRSRPAPVPPIWRKHSVNILRAKQQ
jgi:hypothetical protein